MDKTGKQMRLTPDDLAIIKSTFKGNDTLLKLMRKVFLPELDPTAPLSQLIDLWMTVPVKDMSTEQAMINILARNTVIGHLDMCLTMLSTLANVEEPTAEEQAQKDAANSTQ